MNEYLERAEYIKKTVLTKNEDPEIQGNGGGGGSGQAAKKKYSSLPFFW